mmetsp:Transcript_20684/g.31113  ORF Transcript_20684/g.31113 Transcript_20684/m.31113 type:complete len:159 (-) Transcript_20684:58-534(-)|eukprot:CAMPEP_0178902564 /NCGR_PEP_ID=MMETSP0786-20121207/4676_1 /TAXON_ID=186022 /ORGANISM="Thalassionema frauenfeldii, Strain CCMP 1798" /LENGTH=158 /DNA_ID=CAMNT_0020573847 /DNA_START=85 /DNA_END=561 /DNA_ORIENTATION=+
MTLSFVTRSIAQRSLTRFCNSKLSTAKIGSIRLKTYYTPAHEYITVEDGGEASIGITDFAQSALGDVVFVDLPDIGDEYDSGDAFGSVESVKAASDVYAPVSGKVTAINDELDDNPGLVNAAAETDAWFIKMQIDDELQLDDLMGSDEYKAHCEAESS